MTFDCKYHLLFVPKYRKKKLYGEIRRYLGPVFRELAQEKGCKILEGHMVRDHVHMLISISPKYAVLRSLVISRERVRLQLLISLVLGSKISMESNFWHKALMKRVLA